jgi:hypothetical protein
MLIARKSIRLRRDDGGSPRGGPRRAGPSRAGRLPTLAELDRLLAAPAIPVPSREDPVLNALALALTEAYGRRTTLAPDSRVLFDELYGGAIRLEVRTDRSFHTAPSLVPNVYLHVQLRSSTGFREVARRSSGRGLLEGGDLRPDLAEILFLAVARRRDRAARARDR